MNMIIIVSFSLFSVSILSVVNGLIGYDCNIPIGNISAISNVEVSGCTYNKQNITKDTGYIQLVQLAKDFPIRYRQCSVLVKRIIYDCTVFSYNNIVKDGYAEYYVDLSREQCQSMHTDRTLFLFGQFRITDLKVNGTVNMPITLAGNINYDGKCKGTFYRDQYGQWDSVAVIANLMIKLSEGTGVVQPLSDRITIAQRTTCAYDKGYCMDIEQGLYIWNYDPVSGCDKKLHVVLYEGPAEKIIDNDTGPNGTGSVTYMAESDGRAFAVKITISYNICGGKAYRTEHPSLIIITEPDRASKLLYTNPSPYQLDLMTYINSKFVLLDHVTRGNFESLYRLLVYQQCIIEYKLLKQQLALSVISPVEFAYVYTDMPGHMATIAGEVIYLSKCSPVPVEVRKVNKCYTELPVVYNNRSCFLTPRSHLIVDYGTEVICSDITYVQYKLGDQWYSIISGARRISPPAKLSPQMKIEWGYTGHVDYATEGIYTVNDLDNVRRFMLAPAERSSITNTIANGLYNRGFDIQGLKLTDLFDDHEMKKLAESTFYNLWSWMISFGTFSAGVIGVLIVIHTIKVIVETLIHVKILYDTMGFGLHLLAAVCASLTALVLHLNNNTESDKNGVPEELPLKDENNQEEASVLEPNTRVSNLYPTVPGYSHISSRDFTA